MKEFKQSAEVDPYDATSAESDNVEDGPAIETESEDGAEDSRCCNAVCALAYTSLCFGTLHLIGMAWYLGSEQLGSMRLLRVTVLLNVLVNAAGVSMLDRRRNPARGCKCCPCSLLFIPWILITLGATNLAGFMASAHFDSELQWIEGVVPSLTSLLMIAFGVQWIYFKRHGALSSQMKNSSDLDPGSPEVRFAAALAQDGRKYEFIYIVAEGICMAAVASFLFFAIDLNLGDVDKKMHSFLGIHLTVIPICLVMRVRRYCSTDPSGPIVSGMSTGLDTFVFTWNAIAAGWIGHTAVTSFIVNILLTYSVITFLPFWRAAIVVPVCYVGYSLAAVLGGRLSWSELILLGVGLGINLAAKRMIESSKYKLFLLLEEKGRQATHEKVLRCQAEFEKEYALSRPHPNHTSEQSSYLGQQLAELVDRAIIGPGKTKEETAHVHPPLSLHSAPTLLISGDEKDTLLAKPANCLPTDASVWLEGEALPRQLHSVEPGHRILCYDRLGGSLKHAEISDMQEVAGEVVWNTVTLTDGTTLKLTADHPVQPVPSAAHDPVMFGPWNTMVPIESRDLRPGLDSLLVLKVSPVQVLSVDLKEEVGTRVALSVQQPERHAIFVAPAKQPGGSFQTMAVESSAAAGRLPVTIGAHKTFLAFKHASPSDTRSHPQSAPPSVCVYQEVTAPQYSNGDGQYLAHSKMAVPPSEASLVHKSTTSSSESETSMMSSHGSDVVVRGPLKSVHPGPGAALSSMLAVKEAGLQSLGSSLHSTCNCKPCAFENRHQFFSTKPCVNGAFCEFCHAPHVQELRDKKRKAARARRREGYEASTTVAEVCRPSDAMGASEEKAAA